MFHDLPRELHRGGVVAIGARFKVERAERKPAFAELHFHERRVRQVELGLENGAEAAAVWLFDRSAGDAAAVAPMPAVAV